MEPEQTTPVVESSDKFENLKKVTPLSKYLAMTLFIIMPFLGGWIGYTYAPEKVVEVEMNSVVNTISETTVTQDVAPNELLMYRNQDFGFEMELSKSWLNNMKVSVVEHEFGRSIRFELPDNKGHYETACYISVSTQKEWEEWQQEEMGKPVYLTEKGGLVYGYGCGHDDSMVPGFGNCSFDNPQRSSEICPYSSFKEALNTVRLLDDSDIFLSSDYASTTIQQVDLSGLESIGERDATGNAIITQSIDKTGRLVRVDWTVTLEAHEPSHLSEMALTLMNERSGQMVSIIPTSGIESDFSGNREYSGSFDLASYLSGIDFIAGDTISVQLWEEYDDLPGRADGVWKEGILTATFEHL